MMVGELNYQNNFLDPYLKDELPFGYVTYFILVQFTLLMPILLVNLMVSMIWQLVVSINIDSVKRILPVNTFKLLNSKCAFCCWLCCRLVWQLETLLKFKEMLP